ncbi:MAG: tRNA uridine-5-carboxymethylaminomethyl(34) synthesis GTPase MnmE [Candidatus Omnitrophica bacterium]|nr:tRNA uridine-5-carboxymethylaminomethyl(34) synthesis GTPase MnmE [Candidatus Omnitrophota bacterium]
MYQFNGFEDTIAAIATPSGAGGIGIVRISGKDAIALADQLFRSKSSKKLVEAKGFTVHYGWIVKNLETLSPPNVLIGGPGLADSGFPTKALGNDKVQEEIVDEVLVTLMRAPKSYTGDDVVEISCHGGWAVVRLVLDLVLGAGARLAEPGEFTKRAFLSGRIDLAQAEAVLDIIRAKTETFVRVSQNQLKGQLSEEIESIRQQLMSVYTTLEALINFPEDDITTQVRDDVTARIEEAHNKIQALLANSNNGRLLKEGIRVVLCGRPNVGKSSLLNILLKQQRAIVTDIAGTTRDVLEEEAQIQGIPLNLVDTAGILEPRDLIEKEAIKRSHLYIENADLVLLVLDNSVAIEEQDRLLIEQLRERNVIVVVNKNDLPTEISAASIPFERVIKVCALTNQGIDELEDAIVKSVWQGDTVDTQGVLISNLRHIQALKQAIVELQAACGLMDEGLSIEFISEHVKTAAIQLDAVLGRNIDEDLLESIFSEFCIGK